MPRWLPSLWSTVLFCLVFWAASEIQIVFLIYLNSMLCKSQTCGLWLEGSLSAYHTMVSRWCHHTPIPNMVDLLFSHPLSHICTANFSSSEDHFDQQKTWKRDIFKTLCVHCFSVGETGDGSYTGELLQSSVCQAGTREDSLTNINL